MNGRSEVAERLKQLRFIVTRVLSLEDAFRRVWRPTQRQIDVDAELSASLRRSDELAIESQALTELFYYSAYRITQIVRGNGIHSALPGFENFECEPIRWIRNALVDQPDGRDRVYVESFQFGAPTGPRLKMAGSRGRGEDDGLFANAATFEKGLVDALKGILSLTRQHRPSTVR